MRLFLKRTTLVVAVTLMSMVAAGQEKSLVERLGYPAQSKLLIVHADDMGMSHNVNVATLEAMSKGWVSSASIMVPCAWFAEAAAMAREHPGLDLGVHLTLTAEWRYYRWGPVSPIDKVKGLLDKEGYLWHDVPDVLMHASPLEVETEIRAQVQRALDFGIKPTHIDTHMGTLYAGPAYFDAYRKVAHEFKLPYMVPRPTPELLSATDPRRLIFTRDRVAEVEKSGDVMLDQLTYDIHVPAKERPTFYANFIKSLKPGVTQLIIHCGGDTEELRAITSSWDNRVADAQAFMNPAIKKALDESGVRLIGWAAIKKLQYGQ